MFISKWQFLFDFGEFWLFYMAEVWALYLYIIWTKCIPDHFLFHQILSLYHVVPWSASFSHRAGIKVHFVDHYFIKRYLVTNFSHTCTRSSLDVNHFVEWPLFYQWTESLLLINSKSRIYLFIYIYLFSVSSSHFVHR